MEILKFLGPASGKERRKMWVFDMNMHYGNLAAEQVSNTGRHKIWLLSKLCEWHSSNKGCTKTIQYNYNNPEMLFFYSSESVRCGPAWTFVYVIYILASFTVSRKKETFLSTRTLCFCTQCCFQPEQLDGARTFSLALFVWLSFTSV